MRPLSGKTYWLVGASEGLGRAVAERLAAVGAHVIVSARNAERLEALAAELGPGARAVPVDVSDRASVDKAAAAIGEIDGVVYLAGLYWPTPATEWDADNVEAMCDVNFNGGVRAIGAVLPGMLERRKGHVVITGSLAGFRGLPGAIGYGASKAALMSLGQSMYLDLRGSGVDVQVINPGYVRTRLTDKNDFSMPYIMEPEEAARHFVDHMKTEKFARTFPGWFGFLFWALQLLPQWAYRRVFSAPA